MCKNVQNGLQVFFGTEKQDFPIYEHYELQPNAVNGRPYFKMGSFGFWWDGIGYWWIGSDSEKGQSFGVAWYDKDVFCPHQLSEWDWALLSGTGWYSAENDLGIICKCIFIQNKTVKIFIFKER